MEGHTADRKTAADRESYRGARSLMLENRKRKRDSLQEIRGKDLTPVCHLTGNKPPSHCLAVQSTPPPRKAAVPKTLFDGLEVGGFGEHWKGQCRPHLAKIVALLKDLFLNVAEDSPTIVCSLIMDTDVWPQNNRGKSTVSELPSQLHDSTAWQAFVRRLRIDHGYRDVVSGLSEKLFGMRCRFHRVTLVPHESYTFDLPWSFMIQAIGTGASLQTMSFVPRPLLVSTAT